MDTNLKDTFLNVESEIKKLTKMLKARSKRSLKKQKHRLRNCKSPL